MSAWEKRARRLSDLIAAAQGKWVEINGKYRSQIEESQADVNAFRERLDLSRKRVELHHQTIRDIAEKLEELREKLEELRAMTPSLESDLAATAEDARQHEAAHEARVGAPVIQLDGAERRISRLRYRLQLHNARRPLTALTGGRTTESISEKSKSP